MSAVLYKCKVTETDIPYKYEDKNLTINSLMKIELVKKYREDQFTFDVLNTVYQKNCPRSSCKGTPHSVS